MTPTRISDGKQYRIIFVAPDLWAADVYNGANKMTAAEKRTAEARAASLGHELKPSPDGRNYCVNCGETITGISREGIACSDDCMESRKSKVDMLAEYLFSENALIGWDDITKAAQNNWRKKARGIIDLLSHYDEGTTVPPF